MGTATLIDHIGELVTNDGPGWDLGIRRDAAVVVEDGTVAWVGSSRAAPAADHLRSLGGRALVPGFVDSHSHIVFDGDRSAEFASRMAGEPYTGGGIAGTVAATRAASDEALRERTAALVAQAAAQGTTTIEIKSGYGLDLDTERRMLAIAAEFTDEVTLLAAHVVPSDHRDRRADYVELVSEVITPACAPLARWVDVFCEPHSPHAFDRDESAAVLDAGIRHGLRARVHGAQLGPGPGAELAVSRNAASLDHATFLTDADVDLLSDAAASDGPVVTFLPIVEFSTRQPYPDARRVIDRGITVALATDCNPGTNFSSSMPLAIALAVREQGMTPAEALWAATAGGAAALRRDDVGRIVPGAAARFAVIDAPTHLHLAYRAGVPLASALIVD